LLIHFTAIPQIIERYRSSIIEETSYRLHG